MRMSSTRLRVTIPCMVMSMISSPLRTLAIPTTLPFGSGAHPPAPPSLPAPPHAPRPPPPPPLSPVSHLGTVRGFAAGVVGWFGFLLRAHLFAVRFLGLLTPVSGLLVRPERGSLP